MMWPSSCLRYALERKLKVLPIRLAEWPPEATEVKGREQNALVFKAAMEHVDGSGLDPYDVAEEIQRKWVKLSQDASLPEDMKVDWK